ncbi:MAG: DMT family transporter [Acidobacteriota bacterium]
MKFDKTDLYCLLMVLVWGANMPIAKDAMTEVSPLSFNAVRLILASLFLLLLTIGIEGRLLLRRQDFAKIGILAVIGNTIYQIFFILGLHWTKAGNVALLLSGTTILTALLSRALGHERLGRIVWLGISISLAGVILILVESAELSIGGGTLRGDLMIVGSSVCWAIYTVFSRPMMEDYSPLNLTAVTLSAGSLGFLVFAAPDLITETWSTVSLKSYLALIYSFTFALAIGYALWFTVIAKIGPTRTSIYGNLIPFVGLVFSWILLGERITLFQIMGGGLILTGIYLTRRGRPAEAPSAIRRRPS